MSRSTQVVKAARSRITGRPIKRPANPLFHGSGHKLKPGGSLKPSGKYIETEKKEGWSIEGDVRGKKVHATKEPEVAHMFAAHNFHGKDSVEKSLDTARKGYVYRVKRTGHKRWQRQDADIHQVVTKQPVKPTHVQERHPSGEIHWSGEALTSAGHSYPNRGKPLKGGGRSKISHDNLPAHVSGGGGTLPKGATYHAQRDRGSRRQAV